MVPEAASLVASEPSEALEMFHSAGTDARELLVSGFSKDVDSLSSGAPEPVFQALFDSNHLVGYLNGMRSQKIDTFLFARDALAPGVDHVARETVEDLAARILDGNQARSSEQRDSLRSILRRLDR